MIGCITAGLFSTGVAASTNAYESIATVTVGIGGQSSIDFTSIPSTYKHLQIRAIGRSNYAISTGGDYAKLRFNSDTATNYSLHYIQGDGASVAAGATASSSWINILRFAVNLADGVSSAMAVSITDILDYTSVNKNKTVRSLSGMELNTGNTQGAIDFQSGAWYNSANAITSISLTPGNGTLWTQNTQVALYGIKG